MFCRWYILVAHDPKCSASELNQDLRKKSEWSCQWKTSDHPANRFRKLYFQGKRQIYFTHQSVLTTPVSFISFQKHLGVIILIKKCPKQWKV